MRKTIYLAGNIAYMNRKEAYTWRLKLAEELIKDFKVFIPGRMKNAKKCMERDFNYICKSDIFVAKINKIPSWGTAIEIFFAFICEKKIVLFTTEDIEIHGWIKQLADKVMYISYYEEIINYLRKLK